ncbi:MAG: lysophospholipase [Cryomorphaceae bacterium]|jgi:lysophospholipase
MLTFLRRSLTTLLILLAMAWLATVIALKYESHEYAVLPAEQSAIAKAYYEANVEPMPLEWTWSQFQAEPDVELRTGYLDAEQAKGTVVIVPGFTSPIEMQAHAIKSFHAAGFKVVAIDYRGQGGSWRPLNNPEKGYVEDYAILADDVARYAKSVRIQGKPLFFHSISMGAQITMRMAERNLANADAIALVVPMIEINPVGVELGSMKALAGFASAIGLGSMYAPGQSSWPSEGLSFGVAGDCNANPDTTQAQSALFEKNSNLRVNGVTMRWLYESIVSGEHLLSDSYAKNMALPIKMFTAGDDRIVNSQAAENFCESLSQCESFDFATSRHCINRENTDVYDEILRQSVEFYLQHS